MKSLKIFAAALLLLGLAASGHAQIIDKKALTLEAAKRIAAAAEAEAKAKGPES